MSRVPGTLENRVGPNLQVQAEQNRISLVGLLVGEGKLAS